MTYTEGWGAWFSNIAFSQHSQLRQQTGFSQKCTFQSNFVGRFLAEVLAQNLRNVSAIMLREVNVHRLKCLHSSHTILHLFPSRFHLLGPCRIACTCGIFSSSRHNMPRTRLVCLEQWFSTHSPNERTAVVQLC